MINLKAKLELKNKPIEKVKKNELNREVIPLDTLERSSHFKPELGIKIK